MESTDISIIEQKEDCSVENMTFTYSEEERQQIEINRDNANLVFNPKFIQYDPRFAKKYNLNILETLIFGYIDLVLTLPQQKFRVSNEHIGNIFGFKDQHISNCIQKLKELGLIDIKYRMKATGGKLRYITRLDPDYNHSCNTTTTTVVKNKNILNNNIYIKKNEITNYLDEEENDKYRNELYIINVMIRLGFMLSTDKQEILDCVARVSGLMKTFIPRKENGNIDRGIAKSYTDAWYDYWENPPKGKKKPTNFKTSLRNNIEMRSKGFKNKK